jgi:acetyl esterase/lipase
VFAVRPGSVTRFGALEMLDHLNRGIVWAKKHAPRYGIAADRLGLMGASAGGHLALLAAVAGSERDPADTASPDADSRVHAVAAFFPPTDLVLLGDRWANGGVQRRGLLGRLVSTRDNGSPSDAQFSEAVRRISPAHRVNEHVPPVLLIHGDADSLVPLEQSQTMLAALEKAGVEARLIVKPGGGHPWPTIHEEVARVADWFDEKLLDLPAAPAPNP